VNRKVFPVLAMLFVVFTGLQLAEPVAAVQIDKGTIITDNGLEKVDYITQIYNPNDVKIFSTIYVRDNVKQPWHLLLNRTKTLTKTNEHTLEIKLTNPSLIIMVPTDLNAAQYYWKNKYQLIQ